mgnify:CR=1 FL=1
MVIFVGPVFFTLVHSTLRFGKMAGVMVALGIIISDLICILIFYYGLDKITLPPNLTKWFTLTGALLLMGIGTNYIVQKPKDSAVVFNKKLTLVSSFTKGFLVNFVNPFVFLVWAGVAVLVHTKSESSNESFYALMACLAGILTTDLLKVFLAHKIKPFLKPKALKIMVKIFGFVFIGFGLRLILYLF